MTETQIESEDVAATPSEGTPSLRDPAGSEPPESSEQPETEAAESSEADPWEGFELKAPEHSDVESVSAYAKAMRTAGLSPDAAQKALDEIAPALQERQAAALDQVQQDWIEASKKDPVIGGPKFEENLGVAKIGAEKFGDQELWDLLKPVSEGGQGLGNHPAISRMLYRVAKAIVPDSQIVTGRAPEPEPDDMEVEYPVMARQLREKGLR